MVAPLDVRQALVALVHSRAAYDTAAAYYSGTTTERFASARLRQLLASTGESYKINFARTPVDAMLERTEISGFVCPDAGALALLETAWEDNSMGLDAKEVHRMAYEFGDCYLIGWPDDEVPSGVSLYAHDPRGVKVFYDPERPRVKSHAVQVWTGPGTEANGLDRNLTWLFVNAYYPDRVEQYCSMQGIGSERSGVHVDLTTVELRLLGEPISNDSGILPVFHFRTGRPYGRPEHMDAYGPQDMISKVLITMMAAIDYSGFPQRYVLTGAALDGGDDFEDGPLAADTPGLADGSRMESSPGSTWLLSGDKLSVGQFQVSQSENFLAPAQSLIKMMASVTDTPFHYFDLAGDMPSGESLRAAEAPLAKKVADREAQFGVTWHEVFDYVLALNSQTADAAVSWAPITASKDKDSAETAQIELNAGKPYDVVWTERGYDSETVQAWEDDRSGGQAGATPREIAEMVQKVYLGVPSVISAEEARDLIRAAGGTLRDGAPTPELG